ncbi:unnamed protein product [Didymodactylos carnosus]|uniref:Uncharacterized protein n=1 Tax=Didymodactylos carnosus TaxID=1234261 RepID=A0A815EH80_9BILA|nr:unnamed protein product [Didymodactylos carnosus]CAF1311400.1 unnamed protein product [Didymodactylos carnosus]CAF3552998.1 unnamed protein product [Didymodactylos carnosus]CAF4149273.1 unnamed protein product [Didymodactylos carnosus]
MVGFILRASVIAFALTSDTVLSETLRIVTAAFIFKPSAIAFAPIILSIIILMIKINLFSINTVLLLRIPGAHFINRNIHQPESGDKAKQRLDPVFRDVLSKIIEDLTDPELLRRSLRGLTQSSNDVGLLPFCDTLGLDVNYSLLDSSLAKDSKRLAKPESVVAKRETVIERKKQARSKSLTTERDISEYGAGAH